MINAKRILATLLLATTLGACGSPSLTPAHEVATAAPSITVDDAPATAAELDAQRFRDDFGLRSDLAWIRTVAADPGSDARTYGVPLTLDEVAELARRAIALEDIRGPVIDYASAQPDYAGAWIDNDRGGILVVQFAGPTLAHQAALFAKVRPGAPLEVRQVRWTLAELQAMQDQVSAGEAWFATIPAYLYGVGADVIANRLSIQLSSADPDVAAKVLAHFGWPADKVAVSSDGTGALLLQHGTLEVRAVDGSGTPVEGLACVGISDIAGAYDSRPLPMPTTDADGICTIDAAAGDYTIELERGEAPPTVVGRGRATITPKHRTEVTITIE